MLALANGNFRSTFAFDENKACFLQINALRQTPVIRTSFVLRCPWQLIIRIRTGAYQWCMVRWHGHIATCRLLN